MRLASTAFLMVAMGVAVGCQTREEKNPQVFGAATDATKPATNITDNDELEEKPGKFIDRTVKLKGDVEQVVSERAFKMEVDDFMGQDEILVVNETGFSVPVREGDEVEVQGPMKIFVASHVEKDVDPKIVDELYPRFGNQPMIVAEVIKGYWAENRPTVRTQTAEDEQRPATQPMDTTSPAEQPQGEEAPSH